MAIILNSPVQGKNDVPSVTGSPVAVKSYTTAQVNALTGQDPGTIVWDSDELAHKTYNGTDWVAIASGGFHSELSTVGAAPSPFPDSFTVGPDGLISGLFVVSFRRTDAGPNIGHAGQILLRTSWTRTSGVLRKVADQILGTSIYDADLSGVMVGTSSPSPAVVVINVTGVLSSNIDWTAEGFGITGNAVPPTLLSISIIPVNDAIPFPGTKQYTATGHYSNGSMADLTGTAIWSVINGTGSATIAPGGLATAVSLGTVTIQATQDAIIGSTGATITDNLLVDLSVDPSFITDAVDDAYSGTGDLYLQDAANHLVLTVPTSFISENPGTSRGVWALGDYDNAIAIIVGPSFALSFGSWDGNAGLIKTAGGGIGPDGVISVYRLQDASASMASNAALGSAPFSVCSSQMWVKVFAGDVPDDLISVGGSGAAPYAFHTYDPADLADWKQLFGPRSGSGGSSRIYPASAVDWPGAGTPPVAGIGSVLACFAQHGRQEPPIAGESQFYAFPPFTTGTVASRKPRLTSGACSKVIVGGNLDLYIRFDVSAFWGWFPFGGGADSYIWYAEDALGAEYSLRLHYDGNFKIVLRINDVDVLEKSSLDSDKTVCGGRKDQEVTVRAIYAPVPGGPGSSKIRIAVNGNFMPDASGTATGGALPAMVSFDIGHKNGIRYNPARYNYVAGKQGFSTAPVNGDFIHIGDSISGQFSRAYPRAADFILTFAEAHGDTGLTGIVDIAVQGHSIASQKASWQALTTTQRSNAKAVLVGPIGVNDIFLGSSSATVLADLQDLIDTIAADAPMANILTFSLTPAYTSLFAANPAFPAVLTAVNAGMPALTGVTLFTDVFTFFDDGFGDMKAKWQNDNFGAGPDFLHGNEDMRAYLGRVFYRGALIAVGRL